jgi:nucleotide-binding universal stress UspA family protein
MRLFCGRLLTAETQTRPGVGARRCGFAEGREPRELRTRRVPAGVTVARVADVRLLICFDGSPGSAAAITHAARLFPDARATIAQVWQPQLPFGGLSWGGQLIVPPEFQRELEESLDKNARVLADEGASQARAAGLDADTDVRKTTAPVWRELLAAADGVDADVIVAGSRGYGEMKALLLGSTSQALTYHSRRPLLIVPTPD